MPQTPVKEGENQPAGVETLQRSLSLEQTVAENALRSSQLATELIKILDEHDAKTAGPKQEPLATKLKQQIRLKVSTYAYQNSAEFRAEIGAIVREFFNTEVQGIFRELALSPNVYVVDRMLFLADTIAILRETQVLPDDSPAYALLNAIFASLKSVKIEIEVHDHGRDHVQDPGMMKSLTLKDVSEPEEAEILGSLNETTQSLDVVAWNTDQEEYRQADHTTERLLVLWALAKTLNTIDVW